MNEVAREICEHIKQEKDLFEKAHLIYRLRNEGQIPLKDISIQLGMKSSYVCHILRLRKLPALVVDGYYSNTVSISHLFIISRLHDDDSMIQAYESILKGNLTIIQTEIMVREMLYNVKSEGEFMSEVKKKDAVKQLEDINIKANILQTRTKGKITLELSGSLSTTTKSMEAILNSLLDVQNSKKVREKSSS